MAINVAETSTLIILTAITAQLIVFYSTYATAIFQ